MPSKFNCAPKFDQKVKIPTRTDVKDVFKRLEPKVLDQIFQVDDLIKLLGSFISNKFIVNVLHQRALEVEVGDIIIAANYDYTEDEFCKIAIELILVTHRQDEYILVDRELFDNFVLRVADSLAHELTHMRQYRARDFVDLNYKSVDDLDVDDRELIYLSDPDEIDAYAVNIAAELNDLPNPLEKLARPSTVTIDQSLNLWVYMSQFGTIDNPVVKRLLKKVYKRLT